MSTAELGPRPTDPAHHASAAGVEPIERTGPIPLPAGLIKPGADDVAAIPSPRTAGGRHAARVSYATGPIAVTDAALAAAAATNAAAFAAIYRRYGDALHSFCLGMLRDPDAAADCVHDVFVTAATRLGQLREHDKLRPWLYAIARHEALRRLKHRRREHSTDELPDTPDLADGLEHDLARRELAELVTAACSGLSDRERAVLELHYRQGLDGPALADALGVSATNANTMVGRLRGTVERSLAALLVARHQGQKCSDLATVLDGWDGALTVLMRKRIARHIDHCPACTQARRDLVNPRALLASAPIAIPAPDWLEQHVLTDAMPLVETATEGPAGTIGATAAKSWWPAAIGGPSTSTLVAVLAPLAAAAIAIPLVLLAPFTNADVDSAVDSGALVTTPLGADPSQRGDTAAPDTSTKTPGPFVVAPSTTRYAPGAPSTQPGTPPPSGALPSQRPGGVAPRLPVGAAPAPAPNAARGANLGVPGKPQSPRQTRTNDQGRDHGRDADTGDGDGSSEGSSAGDGDGGSGAPAGDLGGLF